MDKPVLTPMKRTTLIDFWDMPELEIDSELKALRLSEVKYEAQGVVMKTQKSLRDATLRLKEAKMRASKSSDSVVDNLFQLMEDRDVWEIKATNALKYFKELFGEDAAI